MNRAARLARTCPDCGTYRSCMASPCACASEPLTPMIFRIWRDKSAGVIALMPTIPADVLGRYITCYEHVGQHGAASYAAVIRLTRPATPAEAAPLVRELSSAPYCYQIQIRRRRPSWRSSR